MKSWMLRMIPIVCLALIVAGFGFVLPGNADTGLPALTVTVPGQPIWNYTGLTVTAGQVLELRSVGYVCTYEVGGVFSTSGPEGQVDGLGCGDYEGVPPPCGLDHAPYGMLLGKIAGANKSVVFGIGDADTLKAPISGKLYLGVNDNLDGYYDNYGFFRVTFK